jgi:NADH-quinone oxidoreductase subunit N
LSIDLSLIIPEIFILISSFLILLFLLFINRKYLSWLGYLCLIVIITSLILTFIFRNNTGVISPNLLKVNEISNFFRYFFLFSGLALVISLRISKIERLEIYTLILISISGSILLNHSINLLLFILFLEIVTISSYFIPILSSNKSSWLSYLRYGIFGITSSFLLIYFISLVFGLTGSLSLDINIINIEKLSILLIIANIVLIVMMTIRLSLFPFHFWFPPLAKDSGFFTTLFFTILFIPTNLLAFQKIFERLYFTPLFSCHITISLICLTLLFLNIGAIFQKNIWRFLAFSNIAQICFIFVGILYSQYLKTYYSTYLGIDNIILVYLLIYLISTSALIIGLETYRIYNLKTNWADFLEDFRGWGKTNPILSLTLFVILISQIGVPGTAGFLVKYSLIRNIINPTGHFDFEISIFLLINYLIAFYYYGRIILYMWFKPKKHIYQESKSKKIKILKKDFLYILVLSFVMLCSIIILIIGIYGFINLISNKPLLSFLRF